MGKKWKQWQNFIFLGSKITADGECSYEIKRCLLLVRKAMTNLDNVLKSRDITLPTKVCMVSSVQFIRSVVSTSLGPHESQHTRPPCPSKVGIVAWLWRYKRWWRSQETVIEARWEEWEPAYPWQTRMSMVPDFLGVSWGVWKMNFRY